jgi:hypothetical protein
MAIPDRPNLTAAAPLGNADDPKNNCIRFALYIADNCISFMHTGQIRKKSIDAIGGFSRGFRRLLHCGETGTADA